MFLFCTHVVENYHFHVKSVITLFNQSLFVFFVNSCLDLLDKLIFYRLNVCFCFKDYLYGFSMLLHLAKNSCFVQISWNDIVFFFTVIDS